MKIQRAMSPEELDREFERHIAIADRMPPQAADDMLVAYAYFKQATCGDDRGERPTESSNVVQAFKYDAWQRLHGMDRASAKRKYIETIQALQATNN